MTNATTPSSAVGKVPPAGRPGVSAAWTAGLLLVVITVLAFGRCACMDFTEWDDQFHVFRNPHFTHLTLSQVRYFWVHPYDQLYVPLSYTLYALLARIGRLSQPDASITSTDALFNPHVFHIANIILHAANSLLVYGILSRLVDIVRSQAGGRSGSPAWPAFIGTLIFALHPLQVESVAWVSEMRGLLSGFFCLASTALYLRAVLAPAVGKVDSTVPAGVFRAGSYWLALFMFVLALLSKPSAVTLPLALFALDRWIVGRPARACASALAPWLPVVVPFVMVTHFAQPVSGTYVSPLWTRPFVAGDALAFYLLKFVAPWHLAMDYGRIPALVAHRWWGYVTWLVPAALGCAIGIAARARPWLAGAATWSVALLLPVLGLEPFIFQRYSTVADRYVYLALAGPGLAAAVWISELNGTRRRAAYGCFVAALAALTAVTVAQEAHWTDALTLFSYASRMCPDSYEMRNNYGNELVNCGRVDDAIDQYRVAVRLHPAYKWVYNNLGVAMQSKGQLSEALSVFQAIVAAAPNYALGRRNLGHTLALLGLPQEAVVQFDQAVRLDPRNVKSYSDYAAALIMVGRDDDAIAEYRSALRIDPGDKASLYGLGNLLNQQKRFAEAVPCYSRTVRMDPGDADAHAGYAVCLDGVGRTTEALREFQRALAIAPDDGAIHSAYGIALSGRGDIAGAVRELQQAVSLSPSAFHYDTLGTLYVRQGRKDLARTAFDSALDMMPDAEIVKQHLAELGPGK
ncbi:MAG: tetratricopeptide repeat protein [Capsulimonadaceae bacterium]